MKKIVSILLAGTALLACTRESAIELEPAQTGVAVKQVKINRTVAMPYLSSTYQLIDWYALARNYDAFVFNHNAQGEYQPLIWIDHSSTFNVNQDCFGLYTTIGDYRTPERNPMGHESINTIAAVLGGGLVGIDKTNQNGYNYVKMLQNYYARLTGWGIMLNGTSGYARDWWYNVLPNVLYWGVCDVFPRVEGADDIQKSIADKFAEADKVMGSNYAWSYFDYKQMKGYKTNIPAQQDAAGGHGYVLLNAWRKFGDPAYLEAAKSAIETLDRQGESRLYEILLPFGAYAAAVLNASQGTNYNVLKMLDWSFDGCKSNSGRKGWAVTAGTWGPYDISGLQGSITDGGGYAFLMNSLEYPWPVVPIVKYQPQFAASIGFWMYHLASACRLFYPYYIDDEHQYAPELKQHTGGVVGYEGLRYSDRYGTFKGVCPIAEGDGPSWNSENGTITMFSLYSSSPVGILGSLVSKTDVEGVTRVDCNVTDFYAERPFPVNLYYNPYTESKTVTYDCKHLTYGDLKYEGGEYDLFDIVSKDYLAKGCSGNCKITLQGRSSAVLVELPAGTKLYQDGTRIVDSQRRVIAW